MPSYDEDTPADLAVVGLGPAGLAAALHAAESGKQVLAFTDRAQYVRQQRVFLREGSYVHELIALDKVHIQSKNEDELDESERADRQFYTRLDHEKTTQIKDVENYLFRKLSRYQNVTIVQASGGNRISHVGTTENCSFIETGRQRYYCYNILAADGAKHTLADRIKEDLGKEITYSAGLFKPKHQYHASVQLQLNTLIGPSETTLHALRHRFTLFRHLASRIKVGLEEKRKALEGLHWSEPYEPNNYVFTNERKTKFCFTGEIPQEIFDEPNMDVRKEKLKQWASIFIKEKYNIDEKNLVYKEYSELADEEGAQLRREKKAQLQATVFKIEGFRFCEQSTVDLNHGVFACIGDARRTPYYRKAHGLGDGVELAVEFVNSMQLKGFDHQCYRDAVKKIDEHIDKMLRQSQEVIATHLEDSGEKNSISGSALAQLIADVRDFMQQLTEYPSESMNSKLPAITGLVSSLETLHDLEPLCAVLHDLWSRLVEIKTEISISSIADLAHEATHDFLTEHALEIKTHQLMEQIESTISTLKP